MNTKTRILNVLLTKGEASINELAEELGVNGISVRHHLKNFESDGLVISKESRIGQVGRPKYIYSLSQLGMEQFPKSYIEFASVVIDQLKQTLKPEEMTVFFREVGQEFAHINRLDRRQRNSSQRIEHVIDNLNEQGYIMEEEEIDGKSVLVNYHCPFQYIATANPVVCQLSQTMLEELTESDIELTETIAKGDSRCCFIVKS